MSYPILFRSIYLERVWGGRSLESKLDRRLPPGQMIGESWEVADRPGARSVIATGPYAGWTLGQAISCHAESIMGPEYPPDHPFPILVKWLDCRENLSLQVHPPAEVARQLGGEPKTEMWYMIDVDPGAELMAGLKAGVTREQFDTALHMDDLQPLVHKIPGAVGDSLFVQSGRLHAIGRGNVILEIQQNSDTTYRVYDWGRAGLNGMPRPVHVDEALQSIDFCDWEPEPKRITRCGDLLADCEAFRICKEGFAGGAILRYPAYSPPVLISVVSGAIRVRGSETREYPRGTNLLLPYDGDFQVSGDWEAEILVTDQFSRGSSAPPDEKNRPTFS
ncbi:MAG: mannose-6-phosphate isomerase [Opitutae bacterium]|nr:mannose-6-phosphate isomerase [Opitutae bacterium]